MPGRGPGRRGRIRLPAGLRWPAFGPARQRQVRKHLAITTVRFTAFLAAAALLAGTPVAEAQTIATVNHGDMLISRPSPGVVCEPVCSPDNRPDAFRPISVRL